MVQSHHSVDQPAAIPKALRSGKLASAVDEKATSSLRGVKPKQFIEIISKAFTPRLSIIEP